MPDYKSPRDADQAGADEDEQDMFVQIIGQIARLREENDDLRGRVSRLESHSGRGIIHPSDVWGGPRPNPA